MSIEAGGDLPTHFAPGGGPAPSPAHRTEVIAEELRLRRHNYNAHAVEGGLYMGGLAFINANTLLPAIVHTLNGPPWLVSLMPVMMLASYLLPPIFTAHAIDRLHRLMPILVITGIFQRLPYLLAALALFAAHDAPLLALCAVAAAPLMMGIVGGISVTAWQQLVANTVPSNRRPSVFAIRYAFSSFLGILAGFAAKQILQRWPGPHGYALLHLLAFIFLMGSLGVFCTIREPRMVRHPNSPSPGMWRNLLLMAHLVRSDRQLGWFLLARFFRNGVFILTPFLAIHFQQSLHRPESYIGQLLIAQMIGAILGNLAFGWVGDRLGGKFVMLVGLAVFAGLSIASAFATTDLQFQVISFLYGVGFFASEIGGQTLSLELCPKTNRSNSLALMSLVNLPGMLLASWISASLWTGHSFAAIAIVSAIAIALSFLFTLPLREPRYASPL